MPVTNVERSVKWYQDKLGLGFSFPYTPGDDEAWLDLHQETGIGLVKCSEMIPIHFKNIRGELSPIISFQVEDIHQAYENMQKRDVQVTEMTFKEDGGHSFNCVDSDGHAINLWGGWPKE